MRFTAAFIVLIGHARGLNWQHYDSLNTGSKNWLTGGFFIITHMGFEAVVVFFVLSGFLVGGKVLERVTSGTFEFKEYAIDRISRIYVPLLPAFILSAIVGLVCGLPVSVRDLVGNIFGLQGFCCRAFAGNDPLWSLAYEFWFYLLAAFIALILVRSNSWVKVLAMFGLLFVFAIFTRFHAYLLFCWCLGAFSYHLLQPAQSNSCSPIIKFAGFIVGVILTLFGAGFSQFISSKQHAFGDFLASGAVAILILSLGLSLTLPYLAVKKPVADAMVLGEHAGTRLAAFSYTLYLTHHPLLRLWGKFHPEKYAIMSLQSFGWYFMECASCLLIAWLLYLPFEAQTSRVRQWMRKSILFRKI